MAVILGFDKVLKNLNKELNKIEGRTAAGMALAGQKIKNESQDRTPVEFGNLKGSHYVDDPVETGDTIVVQVGVTAEYGPSVHENLEANHNVGEAKFLEKAVVASAPSILNIVAKRAKIR